MRGKNAVIIGRSNIVGKPMSALLLQEDCTVTIAHSKTEGLQALCKTADILIAAVGQPEIVRGAWIKPGATVIDVGINRLTRNNGQTRLVGDVAFEEAKRIARAITPVPGGVGPMTIVCLLANTVSAASLANNLPAPDWL
ncbi:MAG: bifunctional methylenetetrahydrofolate dehydrogenase/methenyltetrahydrofolate cyclohydrolase, partial [Hyphomicrobiaceae bacterium]|nr:bifunctional methylenetetrahydrofolate dehydrogenase/methenyltetrahydrofolate cyclohydrolase [Hyphomicrobiaceae bacterium]